MKYGYINKFTAQPGKREELKSILLKAAKALEANSDCIQYLISVINEPDIVLVSEIWTSKQAHDSSLKQAEIRAIIAQAMPLIASVSNIAEHTIEGGKGLS